MKGTYFTAELLAD